jgi:hypothetical protein
MKETIHKCEVAKQMLDDAYKNEFINTWGVAFRSDFVNYGDSDYFWADCDEYTHPIFFCPCCGLDLRTLLKK